MGPVTRKSKVPSQIKSVWRGDNGRKTSFFCPHCRAPRCVRGRPSPGDPKHFLQVGLTSLVFMFATWDWFNWKGLVSFVPLWVIFEVFYRTRMRAALICEHCGFDPVLYLVDVKKARDQVELHYRKLFEEKGIPYPEKNPPPSIPSTSSGRPSANA